MSSRVAELQVLLEGVSLPAARDALVDYARREGADPGALALLDGLPEREYASLDEVGETLHPVQPAFAKSQPHEPKAESGEPPGGDAYTDPASEPGRVREPLP
jgi:hypothetical protein